MLMKVTEVRVRKIFQNGGKLKAVASVTIDDAFVVHGVKVIEGRNGLFIAMPSHKLKDGGFRDTAHPVNTKARELVQTAVMNAYNEAV